MPSQLTRAAVTKAVTGVPDRLEAELSGLCAFLEFVADRPTLYRIVEEARFAAPEAYKAYFIGFAQAYAAQLSKAASAGRVSDGDPEIRA